MSFRRNPWDIACSGAPDICEILEKQVKLSLKEREDVNQKDAEDLLAKIALAILKVA